MRHGRHHGPDPPSPEAEARLRHRHPRETPRTAPLAGGGGGGPGGRCVAKARTARRGLRGTLLRDVRRPSVRPQEARLADGADRCAHSGQRDVRGPGVGGLPPPPPPLLLPPPPPPLPLPPPPAASARHRRRGGPRPTPVPRAPDDSHPGP